MRVLMLTVAAAVMISGAAGAQTSAPAAAPAQAQAPAATTKPAPVAATPEQTAAVKSMTAADTPIGDLLDNPAAKAIVEKHLPDVVHGDQIDMARGMTLLSIQTYATDYITDAKLAAIDADFKAVK